jgi:hypothetical protein
MALFRNFGINRRNRLCGIQESMPPRNSTDFLALAKNCTFLDRKFTSADNENADGHEGGDMAQPVLVDVLLTDFNQ